jgi:hypothetical protein
MSTEKLYRISWEIDMPGDTPEEAVKQGHALPGSFGACQVVLLGH